MCTCRGNSHHYNWVACILHTITKNHRSIKGKKVMKYCKLTSSNFELAFWVNHNDFLIHKKITLSRKIFFRSLCIGRHFISIVAKYAVQICLYCWLNACMHVVCISEIITKVHTNNTLGLFYDLHINKQ